MAKKRKGNRTEKEKPLITNQGVLRLEKTFVTSNKDDIEIVKVRKTDDAPLECLELKPGNSEHELVTYKSGYDVMPSNPFPQNEAEAQLFAEQREEDRKKQEFELMKKEVEAQRQEREHKFKKLNEEPDGKLKIILPQDQESYVLPFEDNISQEDPIIVEDTNVFSSDNEEENSFSNDQSLYTMHDILNIHLEQNRTSFLEEETNQIQRNDRIKLKQDLEKYKKLVQEHPNDFKVWCYLMQIVETLNNLDDIRDTFNKFLSLFPCSYRHWKTYSDIERKHLNWERSLSILHRGLEAMPICVELWDGYLNLYFQMYKKHEEFSSLFRAQLDRAIQTVGINYKSDIVWDRYIAWELTQNNLKNVYNIYQKLIATPTQIYNKHWDDFVALVRDYHPRDLLDYDHYENLRKSTCEELNLVYRPDPVSTEMIPKIRSVVQPENKLQSGMKERIVANSVGLHEKCEAHVDHIYKFEEKIKQDFFDTKPLRNKEIKNWHSYLDFEIDKDDHERIVVLFERCLVPCGLYEEIWMKYANYMEKYLRKKIGDNVQVKLPSVQSETTNQDSNGSELQLNNSVQKIYERACHVYCHNKIHIKFKWSHFEESIGNKNKAKEILRNVIDRYPLLLEAHIHLIDIERRENNYEEVEKIYKDLIKTMPENRKYLKTWMCLKLARFQFKVKGSIDEALLTLRTALKKDKSDTRIYSHIIDVCYQRHPIDLKGVNAAIELAIKSKEITNEKKFEFVKKKVEFMQDFGSIEQYREAYSQFEEFSKNFKPTTKEKDVVSETKISKSKAIFQNNQSICVQCQGKSNLNNSTIANKNSKNKETPLSEPVIESLVPETEDDEIADLLDLEITDEQEEQIKEALKEKVKYKEVAPTWELKMDVYGYGKKRKTYDPDYEHVETAKFKEYERLETIGYDESLKDPNHDKIRNLKAPGLGSTKSTKKRSNTEVNQTFTSSDYVVPPKVPQDVSDLTNHYRPMKNNDNECTMNFLELPPEIADLQKSPNVNVTEEFLNEGGTLCLSNTNNGKSYLRYWPKFLSSKYSMSLLSQLSKYSKWHQPRLKVNGKDRNYPRLLAWYGPREYNHQGVVLDKNVNWSPKLVKLMEKISDLTNNKFNSCILDFYRSGHDCTEWSSYIYPPLGYNPIIATISLGETRHLEMRTKNGTPSFIRFPLLSGSLLIFEGATQEDWLYSIPKQIEIPSGKKTFSATFWKIL